MNLSWCRRHVPQLCLVVSLSLLFVLGMFAFVNHSRAAPPTLAPEAEAVSRLQSQDRLDFAAVGAYEVPAHIDASPGVLPTQNETLPRLEASTVWAPESSADEVTFPTPIGGALRLYEPVARGRLAMPPLPGDTAFGLDPDKGQVWGLVDPGDVVTVTVNGTQVGADQADDVGFFWTTLYGANGDRVDLTRGDAVHINVAGTEQANTTLRRFAATINLTTNVVSGTVDGLSNGIIAITPGDDNVTLASQRYTTTTSASGTFSYDFSGTWSFVPDGGATVAYVEDGIEIVRVFHPYGLVVMPAPIQEIKGHTAPDSQVTVTVVMSDEVTVRATHTQTSNAVTGEYGWGPPFGSNVDMEIGDLVKVELAAGAVFTRWVESVTLTPEPQTNQLLGQTRPGATVVGRAEVMTPNGWQRLSPQTTADGSGSYTLTWSSATVWPRRWYGAYVPDDEGDYVATWHPAQAAIDVDPQSTQVTGNAISPAGDEANGQPVTLTVYTAVSDTTSAFTTTCSAWGFFRFSGEDGLPELQPGDIVTVASTGWEGHLTVEPMNAEPDLVNNRITGDAGSAGDPLFVTVEQWQAWALQPLYPVGGRAVVSVTTSNAYTASPPGFDIRSATSLWFERRNPEKHRQVGWREVDYVRVWPQHNGLVLAFWEENGPFTVTLQDNAYSTKAVVTGVHPDTTWVWFGETGEAIESDDHLLVRTEAGLSMTVDVPELRLETDLGSNSVEAMGPPNRLMAFRVGEDSTYGDVGFVPTDGEGYLTIRPDQLAQQNGDGIAKWGEYLQLSYQDLDGNMVLREMRWPQIVANYDLNGTSQVWGVYAVPDNPIHITVTHPTSGVIVTATTSIGTCDDCGPYSYRADLPDGTIAPGNSVTVDFGDGYVDTTVVKAITAEIDLDGNVVTGTGPAGQQLYINASHEWDSWIEFSTQIDANGTYTASFQGEGWDILPGDSFNIHVSDDHGHDTQYSFWTQLPDVSVDKYVLDTHVQLGGPALYGIEVHNFGNGVAEDVTLVDALPNGLSWEDDTSGYSHVASGNTVTWTLGDLPPQYHAHFYLTLDTSGVIITGGDVITRNCVTIATTDDDTNTDNNQSCSGTYDVWESGGDVRIEKWLSPPDPVPGEHLDYTLHVCTGGSGEGLGAIVGAVWLTDTLPVSTTLVGWDVEPPHESGLWREIVSDHEQLVAYAPALPGNWCHNINVTLAVDPLAPLGVRLVNTALVSATLDAEMNNNLAINESGVLSPNRVDLRANTWRNHGQLTRGGEIGIGVGYMNEGNTAVHGWLTDTLPAGTSYREGSAGRRIGSESQPFAPAIATDDYLVWDLGTVEVNENSDFWFVVDIDATANLGTVSNCVTLASIVPDATPEDNTECFYTDIYTDGPNLWVEKGAQYEPGWDQIQYEVRVMNLGDETIHDVIVTDTYPAGTIFGGPIWYGEHYDFDVDGPYDDPGSGVLTWTLEYLDPGQVWRGGFDQDLDAPGGPLQWYTNTVEVTLPPGDVRGADNAYVDVQFSGGEVDWVNLDVGRNHIRGCALSGVSPMTLTTAYEVRTYGGDCFDDYLDHRLMPGDILTITAGEGALPVVIAIPSPFEATADAATNQVTGQFDALDGEAVYVQLSDAGIGYEVQTDATGAFTATLPDIPRAAEGHIRWETMVAYAEVAMFQQFRTTDLAFEVNYAHDWVQGGYDAGHTGVLTLTDAYSNVKATAIINTGYVPNWGLDSTPGFSTDILGWSDPDRDIAPGDWILGKLDNGAAAAVQVGTIDGTIDTDGDTITGTVSAAWIAQDVAVYGHPWDAPPEAPNPRTKYDNVLPDGTDTFTMSWHPDLEWDMEPGQQTAVGYRTAEGHRILNVFQGPAPRVRVATWVHNDNQPAEGGNFVYEVQVTNNGTAAAENVVITETLGGATYLTDTLGIAPTGSGPIVWELGTLAAGTSSYFRVFVSVGAPANDQVTHTVTVATSNPHNTSNEGERTSVWVTDVILNDAQLNLGKESRGEPTPGHDARFTLNVCNDGTTASGTVVITDSLPPSLTLTSWSADRAGWREISRTDHELVVTIPAVGGRNQCHAVDVYAMLDSEAWFGMPISNTGELTSTSDLTGGDNSATWHGTVEFPHQNAVLNKGWRGGRTVPGGRMVYHLGYYNSGNVEITETVRITETLPAGTQLEAAWIYDDYDRTPFGPAYEASPGEGRVAVWEIDDDLPPGGGGWFEVVLGIDPTVSPGTVLTNCAVINHSRMEESPYDNAECVAQEVQPTGLNLRVTKAGTWRDGGDRIEYVVDIENVGTTLIENILVTDTLPVTGTLGSWWIDHQGYFESGTDGDIITITMAQLQPGQRSQLYADLHLSSAMAGGIYLLNRAEIGVAPTRARLATPGDVNPEDNEASVLMGTGPDLAVDAMVTGGSLRPGTELTYTLHLQNAGGRATTSAVWVTDTLPSDVTFERAVWRQCGRQGNFCEAPPSHTDGNILAWEWDDPVYEENWQDLIVTVRISETVIGGALLTSEATIGAVSADDVEPDYANNTSSVGVTALNPVFAVGKDVDTGGIAGMPVTYTLAVTNTGNLTGTNVVLSDTVPAALVNPGGDGSLTGGDMTWTISSLAPGADATGTLTGTLPCTAQEIVNDRYGVVGSDEGIMSPWGAPVTTTVKAPTISLSLAHDGPTMVTETVHFTATAATDGTGLSYTWDFGEGSASGTATAGHSFPTDGTHPVTVTVTDGCGFSETATAAVRIEPPEVVAAFDYAPKPANIIRDQSVMFTDTSTTESPAIVAWLWAFGDGDVSATANPAHVYETVGTFTVTLTVTDSYGYSDTVVQPSLVSVASGCVPLTGIDIAGYAPASPIILETVTFTATITPVGATQPLSFIWAFGDGVSSTVTALTAQHTYTTDGSTTVKVTGYNPCTPSGVAKEMVLTVAPRRVYLPLIIKGAP